MVTYILAVRLVCYRGNEHFGSKIVLVPKYRITSFIRVFAKSAKSTSFMSIRTLYFGGYINSNVNLKKVFNEQN